MSSIDTTQTAPAVGSSIPAEYDKRLMVAAGRASQELGAKIADRLEGGAHRPRPEDVLRR